MTRAELIKEARDVLDETSEAVLTSERAYRAFNRVVSDWSAGTGCLLFGRETSARPHLSYYTPPDIAVGLVRITPDVAAGNKIVVNDWEYTVTPSDVSGTTDKARKVAATIYGDFLGSSEFETNGTVSFLHGDWLVFLGKQGYFTAFSADGGIDGYTTSAVPHSVCDVVWNAGAPVRLRKIGEQELLKRDANWATSPKVGVPQCWAEIDGHIVVTPAPSSSGTVIVYATYLHPAYPASASFDNAPLMFPDSHKQGIVYGLVAEFAVIIRDREGIPQLLALYKQLYETEKGRVVASEADGSRLPAAWDGVVKWRELR